MEAQTEVLVRRLLLNSSDGSLAGTTYYLYRFDAWGDRRSCPSSWIGAWIGGVCLSAKNIVRAVASISIPIHILAIEGITIRVQSAPSVTMAYLARRNYHQKPAIGGETF